MLSDKMKASEVWEEVFLTCDNCGKNFTTRGMWLCDQTHHDLTKFHKSKCDHKCDAKHEWKGVKETPNDET